MSCQTKEVEITSFDDYLEYTGTDLGLTQDNDGWMLRIWAPTAKYARVKLYENGSEGSVIHSFDMEKNDGGTWTLNLNKDYTGRFYTFQVKVDDKWSNETVDPYVKLVGVNGKRGFIYDELEATPLGWENDKPIAVQNKTDIIIYELHIRDLSVHESSGIRNKGLFKGFIETETVSPQGEFTGLAHLKELGITHVHLLPVFDFRSIDESKTERNDFNWGYDPQNYNVPEGSYAVDPNNPFSRVIEFKSLIQTLHNHGIGVIMDVVYNHTGFTEESVFNQLVPGYYYRQRKDGTFSDAAACGNETASERPMMRKFIKESMSYWMEAYHLDGFRIDLMGIHDIETMNQVSAELLKINPSAIIYGEGWTAGSSPLPDELRALKANTQSLNDIAAFSDELRDGVKGHWSDKLDRGFVSGKKGSKESLYFGIAAAAEHPGIDYEKVNYAKAAWAREPWQTINYVSCHDDLTLWDKLNISSPETDQETLIKMHLLANTIVLTAQGIPFLHGGVDMLRTKFGNHNSYNSPDSINAIDWERKTEFRYVFDYYRDLIALRKAHPAFRMMQKEQLTKHLSFIDTNDELFIGFDLKEYANGDKWKTISVYFNGDDIKKTVSLPENNWYVALMDGKFYMTEKKKAGNQVTIPSKRALIVYQE